MICVFKYVLIQVWMLRLLIIEVLTCTMGASGTYHPYVFALKNHFHYYYYIIIKLSCFVILLKMK